MQGLATALEPVPECCESSAYTPDPSEVLGRWVGFGSTLQLYVLPANIPVAVIAQHLDVWSNYTHIQTQQCEHLM